MGLSAATVMLDTHLKMGIANLLFVPQISTW